MRRFISVLAAAVLASSLASQAMALDDRQKQEIGDFVRQYLIENPEIMLDVQEALQKKQDQARQQQAGQAIGENKTAIFNATEDAALGNPKGDVTIVEFFDYNCTYCRHALPDMQALVEKDKNIRFVLKEFPILGPESLEAHRVSAAFRRLAPEKYSAFHIALLSSEGRADEASALAVAGKLGVSEADLRSDMQKNPDDMAVQKAYQLAQSLGITGTPSYVIGDELVQGAVGVSGLEERVKNMRQCGKSKC